MKKTTFLVFPLLLVLQLTAQKKTLSLEQILKRNTQLFIRLPNAIWTDDTHFNWMKKNEAGKSVNFSIDAATGKETELTTAVNLSPINRNTPDTAVATKDGKGVFYKVKDSQKQLSAREDVKNPELSPDGKQVAFVSANDLYVIDIASGKEQRLTHDGTATVYNGLSSWVYNEEILGRGLNYRAYWWSPDSKRIAFMRTDDTEVPVYTLFDDQGQHGKYTPVHYPQPGDPNPKVKMGIANVTDGKVTWADFNENTDQYFGAPYWTPDGSALWVQWMNRRQDSLIIYSTDLNTGKKQALYVEYQKTWVSLDDDKRITFVPGKNEFILMSDKSGWQHMYLYNMQGKLLNPITSGEWRVEDILLIDKNGWVFFTGRKENSARTDLYKVRKDGTKMQRLTFGDYHHRVTLSPQGSYFVTTYSNVTTPARAALLNNEGKLLKELGDERGPEFDDYQFAKTEILRVPSSDGKFQLPVRVTWPMNLDPSKKYPVKIAIYGGPGMSFITDIYSSVISTNNWLSQEGVISVSIDHRGSGHFGKKGMDYMYGNLGYWEIEDYSATVNWLKEKYPFIDPSRIMISGFSYGGYLTSLALTKGADVFTHGIAGGSVTDWKLYDTHYTERYMGLPKDNPKGYEASAVMPYANRYKGLLRLVQGTMDDNVHVQNTLQLASALQSEKKHFEMMLYPGMTHSPLTLGKRFGHYQNEDIIFIYQNLLRKEVPELLLKN